jgi:hypothetical protein
VTLTPLHHVGPKIKKDWSWWKPYWTVIPIHYVYLLCLYSEAIEMKFEDFPEAPKKLVMVLPYVY